RTRFRMPDLIAIALGGGTILAGSEPEFGPASVGYALTEQAIVFGGGTLTATDLAVAAGITTIGDAALVSELSPCLVNKGLKIIRSMLEESIDAIKLARGDEPVIAVGGGSFLVPKQLVGSSNVVHVEHSEV